MRTSLLIGSSALLLLSACGDSDVRGTETVTVTLPSQNGVVDPQHGKEVWFAVGPVNGTAESAANGLAQAHYFEDGFYVATVQANILPKEGMELEAWVLPADNSAPISMGKLQSPSKDARHSVNFETKTDFRTAKGFEITSKAPGSADRGMVVATATLTVRER